MEFDRHTPRGIHIPLGRLCATPGVLEQIDNVDVVAALRRHARGDWGDLCDDDKRANNEALRTEGRLLSSYLSRKGVKFWIITEADRSVTTVLLPEEY